MHVSGFSLHISQSSPPDGGCQSLHSKFISTSFTSPIPESLPRPTNIAIIITKIIKAGGNAVLNPAIIVVRASIDASPHAAPRAISVAVIPYPNL